MATFAEYSKTSLFKKFVIALSGLSLVGFVVVHLLGNLTLYAPTGTDFNAYAAFLESFGGFLTVAEISLVVLFATHSGSALLAQWGNQQARPKGYRLWKSKNGNTPSSKASRNMAISGSVLLIFLIIHIIQFRFGPSIAEGYSVVQNGHEIRDLYRLVSEVLHQPWAVGLYAAAMVALGFHLNHAIWSATQSLGLVRLAASNRFRLAAGLVGVLLAVGFFFLPFWIYFQPHG